MRKSSINSLIRIKKIPNKKSISTSISLTRLTTQTQNKIVKNENQNLSLLNSFSKIKIIKKNNSVNLNNNTINIKKNKTNSSLNLSKKIPFNSNEYWHLIDPKLHTNKIQLNWNFNLRIYNNNNNNKKFVRSFSAPSFYEEDLNKYKKKLSNKNKITDDDKNKNYINIKHLFKNNINGMFQTNNHFNFEVNLRDFK